MSPKVSVIVPVYNAEKYLRSCLESIFKQTLQEIEIICVDDGSADASMDILQEYAHRDPRMTVLTTGKNQYAGAARNMGMAVATGEYLSFLDSDDFFEPDMLEAAYLRAKAQDADIVLYDADLYVQGSGSFLSVSWILNQPSLPEKPFFSVKDIPDWIFLISSPAPWNKLFRRTFVKEQGLLFQQIHSCNDLYFSFSAMAFASRITVVNRVLMHYSTGNSASLQGSSTKDPMDLYRAIDALGQELKKRGLFSALKRSFINKALVSLMKSLMAVKRQDIFEQMCSFLLAKGFDALEITGADASTSLSPLFLESLRLYDLMRRMSPHMFYLFLRFRQSRPGQTLITIRVRLRKLIGKARRGVRQLIGRARRVAASLLHRLADRILSK
jgi:glycosyltransferase involved in cell wall biosynthesis